MTIAHIMILTPLMNKQKLSKNTQIVQLLKDSGKRDISMDSVGQLTRTEIVTSGSSSKAIVMVREFSSGKMATFMMDSSKTMSFMDGVRSTTQKEVRSTMVHGLMGKLMTRTRRFLTGSSS